MDSWQVLLLLQIHRGKYLSSVQPTEEQWRRLWLLVHETYPEMLTYLVQG